jgi:biopolymer transport protein ExbB
MSRVSSLWRSMMVLVVLACVALVVVPVSSAAEGAGTTAVTAAVGGSSGLSKTSMGEAFFIMRNPLTHKVEWVGTLLVWVLIVLSISCTSLIGTLMWTHRRPGYVPAALVDALKSAFYEKRTDAAYRALTGDRSMLGGIVAAGLRQSAFGHAAISRAAEQRADELSVRRLRSIEPLNVIGNVAPMLGLFGTVYGIILSFREIVAGGGTPDPVSLAAGIGTALVATFWGLVVAIPALAFYGILRARIDALTVEAASTAEDLLSQLKSPAKSG